MFQVYFGDDLGAQEHDVGAGLDHIRNEVLIILLQLERVLMEVLGVLDVRRIMGISRPRVPETDFFQMLCALELDKDNNWINLILTQFLHCADVDVNEAVLVVGNDIPDRSVCGALKMTASSFEIDKNIISNALKTKFDKDTP